jgi:hypothetical protein
MTVRLLEIVEVCISKLADPTAFRPDQKTCIHRIAEKTNTFSPESDQTGLYHSARWLERQLHLRGIRRFITDAEAGEAVLDDRRTAFLVLLFIGASASARRGLRPRPGVR